jgi:hypothetical protein
MALYEKFTYDLGDLHLTKADKAKLEREFDGPGEYLVCTDETADAQAKGEILSCLWAFNPNFLSGITGLDSKVFEQLAKLSEDSNGAVTALVKSTCGLDHLVEQAIAADGRGHFLAQYDSEENEFKLKSGKFLYLYRCN